MVSQEQGTPGYVPSAKITTQPGAYPKRETP